MADSTPVWSTRWLNPWQLKERGWTDTAIQKFLGEPDLVTKVPRRAWPVRWYRQERVEQIEQHDPNFRKWQKRLMKRRQRLDKEP